MKKDIKKGYRANRAANSNKHGRTKKPCDS